MSCAAWRPRRSSHTPHIKNGCIPARRSAHPRGEGVGLQTWTKRQNKQGRRPDHQPKKTKGHKFFSVALQRGPFTRLYHPRGWRVPICPEGRHAADKPPRTRVFSLRTQGEGLGRGRRVMGTTFRLSILGSNFVWSLAPKIEAKPPLGNPLCRTPPHRGGPPPGQT